MSGPHNEEQPIIDAMERGDDDWWDADADAYSDVLARMEDVD
jgi:hypothetical protein